MMRYTYWSIIMVAVAGCTSEGTAPDANLPDPTESVAKAFELLDTNSDGMISADELKASPGLKVGAARIDRNGDGNIARDELEEYVAAFAEAQVLLVGLSGTRVTYDGRPLAGASVTLVPEPFLEGQIKPATGVTDANGFCELTADGFNYNGVQIGFYRVSISMQDPSGRETIPAKYNSQTDIGVEVTDAATELDGGIVWALYSR